METRGEKTQSHLSPYFKFYCPICLYEKAGVEEASSGMGEERALHRGQAEGPSALHLIACCNVLQYIK